MIHTRWIGSVGIIVLAIVAFAMVASAQVAPNNPHDWPPGIPNPWKHVESGPDESHYAEGLIEWLHYAGSGDKPGQDPLATSYVAHMRIGDNATALIAGPEIHPHDPIPPVPVHEIGQSPYAWK
jgi:hypothetical protein